VPPPATTQLIGWTAQPAPTAPAQYVVSYTEKAILCTHRAAEDMSDNRVCKHAVRLRSADTCNGPHVQQASRHGAYHAQPLQYRPLGIWTVCFADASNRQRMSAAGSRRFKCEQVQNSTSTACSTQERRCIDALTAAARQRFACMSTRLPLKSILMMRGEPKTWDLLPMTSLASDVCPREHTPLTRQVHVVGSSEGSSACWHKLASFGLLSRAVTWGRHRSWQ
jgi:hypothetical protein